MFNGRPRLELLLEPISWRRLRRRLTIPWLRRPLGIVCCGRGGQRERHERQVRVALSLLILLGVRLGGALRQHLLPVLHEHVHLLAHSVIVSGTQQASVFVRNSGARTVLKLK